MKRRFEQDERSEPGKASDERLRVCFVAPKAYPLFNPDVHEVIGGAELDLYYLATELARDERFEVSFIVADYGQDDAESIEGVTVLKSVDFRKNALSGVRRIWRAMRRADADIYMMKTVSPGVPLASLFCRRHHRALVYRTACAAECDGTYLKQHPLLGRLFNRSLRSAALVFSQNRSDGENLRRTTGVASFVLPNGHRIGPLTARDRDTVLWVGRSAEIKRPELFVRLAETVPQEHFTMICPRATGDDRYDELLSLAQAVENLDFLAGVPFVETEDYFRRAKVFVNTSDAEGFPNTFIQAGKAAAPILSLNVNPDGFLDRYSCGLCCGGDLQRLADSLRLMPAEDRFEGMGRNARKYVLEHHDIVKVIEEYKEHFLRLGEQRHPGRKGRGKCSAAS